MKSKNKSCKSANVSGVNIGKAAPLPLHQLPNYSTYAAEFFLKTLNSGPSPGIDPIFLTFVYSLLSDSQKFILPDNGKMFSEFNFKPSMFELQHLPFPICALEFTADDALYQVESGLLQASKRIVLCFDPHRLSQLQDKCLDYLLATDLAVIPAHAICIVSVWEPDDFEGLWLATTGMTIIDLDHGHPVPSTVNKGKYSLPLKYAIFPPVLFQAGISVEDGLHEQNINTIDEVRATFEFLAILNCANVGIQEIKAPKMINAKRARKGKEPFNSYLVLDIDPPSQKSPASPHQGGSHASPRGHVRRGHIRRYPNNSIWINDMVINADSEMGWVEKKYRMRKG